MANEQKLLKKQEELRKQQQLIRQKLKRERDKKYVAIGKLVEKHLKITEIHDFEVFLAENWVDKTSSSEVIKNSISEPVEKEKKFSNDGFGDLFDKKY